MGKLLGIALNLAILVWFGLQIYNFYTFSKHLQQRALIVIADNSNYLAPGDVEFLEKNRTVLVPIASVLMGVRRDKIKDLGAVEIVDKYGSPYIGKHLSDLGQGYSKKVVLSGDTANLAWLRKYIEDYNNAGLVVDIILVAHGNEQLISLNQQNITWPEIEAALSPIHPNLGFVYLASCFGSAQMEMWRNLGARVVNGSVAINNYPVFAPGIFLTDWTNGKTFSEAVTDGYKKEIWIWKTAANFWPDMRAWVDNEATAAGQMIFSGDKKLSVVSN